MGAAIKHLPAPPRPVFFRGGAVPRDAVGHGFAAMPGGMGMDGWTGGFCHVWGAWGVQGAGWGESGFLEVVLQGTVRFGAGQRRAGGAMSCNGLWV